MSNHTPGPWHIIREKNGPIRYIWPERNVVTDGERIASAYTEDNARLIAAAPDLYEACQAAFVLLSEYAPIWAVKVEDQLREALAKTRG